MSRSGGDLTSRPAAAVALIVVLTFTARLAAGWSSSATSGRDPWSCYRWRRPQPGHRAGGVRYPRSSLEACARHRGPASWRPQNVTPKNCAPPAPEGSAGRPHDPPARGAGRRGSGACAAARPGVSRSATVWSSGLMVISVQKAIGRRERSGEFSGHLGADFVAGRDEPNRRATKAFRLGSRRARSRTVNCTSRSLASRRNGCSSGVASASTSSRLVVRTDLTATGTETDGSARVPKYVPNSAILTRHNLR